jgi:hypothetical protein
MLKPRNVILALALLLAMLGDSWGRSHRPSPRTGQPSSPPQTQAPSDQQKAAPDTRGTEQSPLIVRSVRSKEDAATDAADHQAQATANRWALIFSAGAVVGAFIQAFIFIVMIRTSRRQLRAYVSVRGKDITEQGDGNERYIHSLEIRNTGQTPAKRLQVASRTCVLDHPLPLDFDFAIDPPGRNPSVLTLGTGEPTGHDSHADAVLTDLELLQIKSPDSGRRLYTYGTVHYRDVFGRKRWTDFSFFLEYRVKDEGEGRARYMISLHPTENHNDAK